MGTNVDDLDLRTRVDHELGPMKEGLKIHQQRVAHGLQPGKQPAGKADGRSLPWERFKQRHPEYDSELWEECRALYAGGPRLLRNEELMERVFPSHRNEDPEIYKERVRRAHYFPYAGAIIDHLVAGLSADPVTVTAEGGDAGKPKDMPRWWQEFLEDVTKDGGGEQSMQDLINDQLREALIVRTSWTLVDLPAARDLPEEEQPKSRLEQDQMGMLDPYVVPIEAEFVVDWQDDRDGNLEWALVCDTEVRRASLSEERKNITKTFTFYDRTGWSRYEITYDPESPPSDTDPVPLVDEGTHPFKRVPLVRIRLPEGLWAMGKLENLAREHFNKRSALAWAEYKSLFSILYEFLGPEDGIGTTPNVSEAQMDLDRAISQIRGQGHTQIRGADDKAMFVGPDAGPFAESRQSADQIMREMHRVMFSTELSVDVSTQALRRSGESKKHDKKGAAVVLRALGRYIRCAVRDIVGLASEVKGEFNPRVGGAEKFDAIDVAAAVQEAVEFLNGVPQKSSTALKMVLMRIYKIMLGDEVTEKELAEIRDQLETAVTEEELLMQESMALQAAAAAQALAGADADDDDDGDGDDDDRATRRKAILSQGREGPDKPRKRRVFSSSGS